MAQPMTPRTDHSDRAPAGEGRLMARRGSAPGERRGGRAKGVPNKITRDVKQIAQEYGPSAIHRLAWFAGLLPNQPDAINPVAQIAAIKELLDRGYGKATQPVANGAGKPLVIDFRWSDDTAVSPALQPIIEAVAEPDPSISWQGDD
jgi:hypothetical protein